jgi:hypothetical protein
VALPSFALDPANASWGGAIPVPLDQLSVVRLLNAQGEALVARLSD